jgi:transcription termination/antitermination protein NusG
MEEFKWYVLQVYSGHENKVKNRLEKLIVNLEGSESGATIKEVMVPMEEVTELKNGKKVKVQKKLYPGYIMISMIPSEETLHMLNNTQGIIKFVGGGVKPHPLREQEVNKIVHREEKTLGGPILEEEIPYKVGDYVEVVDGPFTQFNGRVEEVYPEKGKVKVVVSLFGRPTPLELNYLQLQPL